MTLALFNQPTRNTLFSDFDGDPDGLRWYQREAVEAIRGALSSSRSTLAVLATGMGKTQIFSAIAKHWPGNVLVLAHRDELVQQARERIEKMTGEWCEVEQAGLRSNRHTRIVVGSVQTVSRQHRLDALGLGRFDLVIVDEAHHYVAETYRRPLEFFADAKVLGVTATPDRGDKLALGKIFESVAYSMDIEDGIEHGYLVPVRGTEVEVKEIDLSEIDKTAGDLVAAQLDEVMLRAVEGIVHETMRLEPNRQGIAFFPGVKSAEYAAARFNEVAPGSACMISGETDKDVRKMIVRDFKAGRYKYLCNCMVATEGFDAPPASLIAIARPTLSRALYAQMAGRGTRVLPGVIDAIEGREHAELRRTAIAASDKPDCMVLDFVGNAGRHSLVTVTDILGGRYTDEEIDRAKKKAKKNPGANPRELLEQSRSELQKLAKAVKAKKVASDVQAFDPFKVLHMEYDPAKEQQQFGRQAMTKDQRNRLLNFGVKEDQLGSWSKADAKRFLDAQYARREAHLCTYKQLQQLQRFGVTDVNIPFDRAKAALNYIQSKGWGRQPVDPVLLNRIISHRREPGEEG